MKYEDALREWGARRIEADGYHHAKGASVIDRSTVRVEMDFDAGFACCGGSDPTCYCSYATSPTAEVRITGTTANGSHRSTTIAASEFDFVRVLEEIVSAGNGAVTS